MSAIEIDGSQGEGGGQVLRTSLTLSMISGQPFRMANIRARRAKPGLMRQHLVAVQAAARVSDAAVTGAEVGSQALTFVPGPIKSGDYEFAIGTAGSCTLVLQTILPALLHGDAASTVRITGGTHNPMAPPVQFLQRAYCPLMRAMGAEIDIDMLRAGFYPAGGGVVRATVKPCGKLRPLELISRGKYVSGYAERIVAGVSPSVARRELECIGAAMRWDGPQLRECVLPAEQGPGNAVLITLEYEHATEVVVAFSEKKVGAEDVAKAALREARRYVASNAAVGEHLADQIMLPLALAGAGRYSVAKVSQHARTNADIIARFLPVRISFEDGDNCAMCSVAPST
ncbi:RNA 3'-terminal phosphate cyclase [Massilia sp. TWR1-2-2]|uniref:RNA 3'-terminal phosphate cyclase n=1 Tax=Massilia sp. TWR1-2-2 TaxID=2804584 RepID=UPI003CE931B8